MKKNTFLILLQAILSLIAGFLVSKMSWIGRVGINFFMPQYKIFKSWWQAGLLCFGIQVSVIFILWIVKKKASPTASFITSLVFLLIAIVGLYFTYNDFQTTISHRLMKEKFHLGFYIFWLGWMGSSIGFMRKR
ncbi:MAG: cytochrome d ubiquinol oxidase subunit II [Chitinophagaceae bacterium]|jgi:hypothetical protein|nr:cytochrome d ubiquinol oxidase subunit II [Chitinophagaceae bacterium]